MRDITQRIQEILEGQLGLSYGHPELEAKIIEELGADSLDLVEIVMALEAEFDIDIPDEEAELCVDAKDVALLVYDKLNLPLPEKLKEYTKPADPTPITPKTVPSLNKRWRDYFFNMCNAAASASKDTSTKVGAVVIGTEKNVLGTAFNGLPMGVRDDPEIYPERYEKPTKYLYVCHAEANIIALAARHGVRLEGSTLFVDLQTCVECCKLIIQAGIAEVYCKMDDGTGKWREHWPIALRMFKEAKVKIHIEGVTYDVGN